MLAKEQRFIDRFASHAAKAAQVQSRVKALDKIEKIKLPKQRRVVKFNFQPPPRSGDDRRDTRGYRQALRVARDLRRAQPQRPARRALGRDGPERRGKDDTAQAHRGRPGAGCRVGAHRRQRQDGLLRAAGVADPGSQAHGGRADDQAGISDLLAPDGTFIHPRAAERTKFCSAYNRPAPEAVTSAHADVEPTGAAAFRAFLRHRSTLVPFLRQPSLHSAARQPAGTGSAQILRSISPKSRRVR